MRTLANLLVGLIGLLMLVIPQIGCHPKPDMVSTSVPVFTTDIQTPQSEDVLMEMVTKTTMAGIHDQLTIDIHGGVIDQFDKGLRMATKDNPPIRTIRKGQLTEAELQSLLSLVDACPFDSNGNCDASTKIIDTDAQSTLTIYELSKTRTITANYQPLFHISNPNIPELTDVPESVKILFKDIKSTLDSKTTVVSEEPIMSAVNGVAVKVQPDPGTILADSQGESSGVRLIEFGVLNGEAEKTYIAWKPPPDKIMAGEAILILNGTIKNEHPTNTHIAMWARGFNKAGEQVCWTLDAAHIMGQIGLELEKGQTGQFTLHLNYAEDVDLIRIFAHNYDQTPP